jgi:uncharacterized protein
MRIDLSDIARLPGARIDREIFEEFAGDEELGLTGPARGRITVTNIGGWLVVEGRASAEVELECRRCDQVFRLPIEAPIREQLRLKDGELTGETAELEPGELSAIIVDQELDVTEMVREQVVLGTPLQPLCDVACKGLCAHCGSDLNEGPCSCPTGDVLSGPLANLGERWQQRSKE